MAERRSRGGAERRHGGAALLRRLGSVRGQRDGMAAQGVRLGLRRAGLGIAAG